MTGRAANESVLYGLLAEFPGPEVISHAVREIVAKEFKKFDVFTPYPMEALAEILPSKRPAAAWIMTLGGVLGGVGAYGLQYWINLWAYPLNIGGRPLHSWPAFLPATFECTVLGASLFGFFGLLYQCRLPRLHHPVFEIERFKQCSTDAFFVCIEAKDPRFDRFETRRMLEALGATEVWDVVV